MWCAGIKLNTNSLKGNNPNNAGSYLKSSSQLQIFCKSNVVKT